MRKRILILAGFSILVHLPGLLSQPLDYHSYAQTFRASVARNFVEGGMHFFEPRVDWYGLDGARAAVEFPAFTYLLAMLWPLFGLEVLWGRVISVVFAALCAVFLYRFARDGDFLGEDAAFFGALAFCALPVRIYFTRTIQPESMALFGVVAGLYFASRPGWRAAIASAALLGLASLLKLPYVYAFLPALWLNRGKNSWIPNFRGMAIVAGALAATAAWYAYSKSGSPAVPLTGGGILYMIGTDALTLAFWKRQFISRFPEIVCTYGGLALFVFGVKRHGEVKDRFLAVWLLGTVAWIVGAARYTLIHEYALLTLAPPVALFIGAGFVELRDGPAPKWMRRLLKIESRTERKEWVRRAAWVLLVSIPIHAGLRIKHWYTPHQTFLLGMEKVADALGPRTDLWLANESNDPLYFFFLHRKGYSRDLDGGTLDIVKNFEAQGVNYLLTARRRLESTPGLRDFLESRYARVRDEPEFLVYRMND